MIKPPTGKKVRSVNLSSKLNPWFLEENDGVVFLHESGAECGLQLWLPEMSSITTDQANAQYEAYKNIMEGFGIEKGRLSVMTFNRPATEEEMVAMRFPATDDPMQQALITAELEGNRERIENSEYMVYETFMLIHAPESRQGVTRSDSRAYSDAEFDQIMLTMNEERDRVISALNNVGIPASPLVDQEPFNLMWRYNNLGQIKDTPPRYDWNTDVPDATLAEIALDETIKPRTLRSQIVGSDILSSSNMYLDNGDMKIIVSDMDDHGDDAFEGMSDKILARFTNFTYVHVVHVQFANEAAIKRRIERKVSAAEKAAGESNKREDQARAGKMSADTMRAYMSGGRFIRMGVSLVVACGSDAQVRTVTQAIKNSFQNEGNHKMSLGKYSNWDQFVSRLATFGGKTTDFLIDQQVGGAASFFPYYGPWYNTGGITLGIFQNAYNTQQRITLPKSSEGAAHMAFIGSTRSGKSFTIQKLLMNLYMMNSYLRIMDVKDDYGPLISWLGGQFIDCNPGSVFEYPTLGPNGEEQPKGTLVKYNIFEKKLHAEFGPMDITRILGFLQALIAKPLTMEQKALLVSAVNTYIESNKAEVNGEMRFLGGTLGRFVDYLYGLDRIGEMGLGKAEDLKKIARQLSITLQVFTQGNYGLMFNGPGTINPTGRAVVFNLSRIKGDDSMMGAVTTMINNMVWEQAANRSDFSSRVVLLSEETGVTGKIEEVRKMLDEAIVAGAAYNLMVILVAQNLDHIRSLGGMLNNIGRIVMGRCKAEEAEEVGRVLKFNAEQVRTLQTLQRVDKQYNELLVYEDKNGTAEVGVIRFRPTKLELALYSSDPEDKSRRNSIMKSVNGDMKQAVRLLMSAM